MMLLAIVVAVCLSRHRRAILRAIVRALTPR